MGHEHNPTAIQSRLGEIIVDYYLITKGTIIWPDTTGRGMVQEEFAANKIIGLKIKGLSGFRARTGITLYLNGNYWSLQKGTLFGAYPKNLHRRTVK